MSPITLAWVPTSILPIAFMSCRKQSCTVSTVIDLFAGDLATVPSFLQLSVTTIPRQWNRQNKWKKNNVRNKTQIHHFSYRRILYYLDFISISGCQFINWGCDIVNLHRQELLLNIKKSINFYI